MRKYINQSAPKQWFSDRGREKSWYAVDVLGWETEMTDRVTDDRKIAAEAAREINESEHAKQHGLRARVRRVKVSPVAD